jgi:superfamily II DNA helicase RecQ
LSRIEASGEDNEGYLNERLTKAVGYFLPDCEVLRTFCQKLADLEIDNKETRRKVHEALNEALTDLDIMCASMSSVRERNFSSEEYARIRIGFLLKDRSIRPARRLKKVEREEGEKGVVNEELREKLQQWRAERFKADNVPAYTIMHQSTLMDIAALIPKTKDELLSIKGFGKAKYDKYGEDILKITSEYLLKNKVNG